MDTAGMSPELLERLKDPIDETGLKRVIFGKWDRGEISEAMFWEIIEEVEDCAEKGLTMGQYLALQELHQAIGD